MARRRQGLIEDVIQGTATLPWWVGVALAVPAYLVLHHFAAVEITAPVSTQGMGDFVGKQLIKILAFYGQYLLPALLLIGALVSVLLRYRRKIGEDRQPLETRTAASRIKEQQEPTLEQSDLYPLYKTSSPTDIKDRPTTWSLELLRSIDWKRFEEVCAEYFRVCGFHATSQSHGPDGGIDITLYAPIDQNKIVNIVQCKRWGNQVGPKLMRELLGVMTAAKVSRGTFVTSSTFNDAAREFATANRIHLIDGEAFLQQILARPEPDQRRLLGVATEGDYLTPSCPSCGIKLVQRERKKDKSLFWGCANYPRCRITLAV